jgi:hypothetical protein
VGTLGGGGGTGANGTPVSTNASVALTMTGVTQPVIQISINGGPMVRVLVDTGSTGLVIESPYVPMQNLGSSIYSGTAGYSGGLTYSYTTYQTTVNFGSGIVTAPTSVNLVNASSQTAFNNYFAGSGVVGVLGIGPNNGFPGTSSVIPALPGTLNNGVLIDEPHGVLEFGPNPQATRIAVAGSPIANVDVKIGSGPLQTVPVSIDSGGVYGTIPSTLLGTGQTSGTVPAGTVISVYTSDGHTLLYSYTTTATNSPTVTSGGIMNTGFEPFLQNPVYIGYSPSGFGTTVFDTSAHV